MSDNVKSYGFIAVIAEGVNLLGLEELNEKLWEENATIRVNYEGTLVYADFSLTQSYRDRSDIYGLFIGDVSKEDATRLVDECDKYGICLDVTTIKPYNAIWYNGSDSPMDQLEKEEFLKA